MKKISVAPVGFSIGTFVGLALFVLVGLLPCAYFAGTLGAKISSLILGTSYGALVGIVMTASLLFSALALTVGMGVVGWLGGMVLATAKATLAMRSSRSGNKKSDSRDVAIQNA